MDAVGILVSGGVEMVRIRVRLREPTSHERYTFLGLILKKVSPKTEGCPVHFT